MTLNNRLEILMYENCDSTGAFKYMPSEIFGCIYSYLDPLHQSYLFMTSKMTVNGLIIAVINEQYIKTSLIYNNMLYACSYNKIIVPKKCCFIINHELSLLKNNLCEKFQCEEIYIQKAHTLKKIGHNFLNNCDKLKKYNIDEFTFLETVGDNWMFGCISLTTFDTQNLKLLKNVGNNWLFGCISLTTIDTYGFTNLQTVGDFWMIGCTSLINFDTQGLTSLQTVGKHWLYDCASLITFNTQHLVKLEIVGSNWMYGCTSLKNVIVDESIELHQNIMDELEIIRHYNSSYL